MNVAYEYTIHIWLDEHVRMEILCKNIESHKYMKLCETTLKVYSKLFTFPTPCHIQFLKENRMHNCTYIYIYTHTRKDQVLYIYSDIIKQSSKKSYIDMGRDKHK